MEKPLVQGHPQKQSNLQNLSENQLSYYPTEIQGQCTLQSVNPITFSICRFIIYIFFCVIFAGIPLLLTFWYPILKRYFYYSFDNYENCTHFLIKNHDKTYTIAQKKSMKFFSTQKISQQLCYFQNRYLKYGIKQGRVKVEIFNFSQRVKNIFKNQNFQGLTHTEAQNIKNCYGPGTMIIKKPHILYLLATQVFRPLYLFLVFSCALWTYESYYYFAGVIFFTSAIAIIIQLYQVNSLNQKIFQMAYHQTFMNVLRNEKIQKISSIELAPGDIAFIKQAQKLPFDGILLEGSALINQCALTGQSVPIVKKASPIGEFGINKQTDKGSFVFQGTTIIQVNDKKPIEAFQKFRKQYGLPVCVIRTNFVTMKGQLIRLISFPKQRQNKFQKQSTKFLIFLFCLSVLTYIFLIIKLYTVVEARDLIVKFFDLITITVPPGLPISMTVGIVFALQKMKKKQIFCISPDKVIVGGSVNYICFDKTGTLTQDYMDFHSILPIRNGMFDDPIDQESKKNNDLMQKIIDYKIFGNMATNHSVIRLNQTQELIGDPMETNLLKFGQIKFSDHQNDPNILYSMENSLGEKIHVYRRFQFDPDLQRMGVLSYFDKNKEYHSFVKGSPEMMKKIMNPNTIPKDYEKNLKKYASMGLRVLAIASKELKLSNSQQIKKLTRNEIQDGLIFNGFQIFQNKLKPQTSAAIEQLFQAEIPCVMITGDNALTGSNISYKCGIANYGKSMTIIDVSVDGQLLQEDFDFDDMDSIQIRNRRRKSSVYKNQSMYDVQMQIVEEMKDQNDANNMNQQVGQTATSQNSASDLIQRIVNDSNFLNRQFCLTGAAFNFIFSGQNINLSKKQAKFFSAIRVFARAKPNDKAKVIMVYQSLGKVTAMCGDGANDCGALKQADIGLSLSQAQASISSPFTSKVANISSMVELLKQCRAGLATNFSLFNIMALYSLTQYCTTVISQYFFAYPADFQYLYWDIVCNFFFFLTIGYTGTSMKLCIQKPSSSLFVLSNLCEVIIMALIQLIGQIAILLALSGLFASEIDYYQTGSLAVNESRYAQQGNFLLDTPETNALFLFTNFMYIFSLLAFNISKPWKKQFFTNIPFMIILVLVYTYSALLVMVPAARLGILKINGMQHLPLNGFIFGMGNLFGIFMYINQKYILQNVFGHLKRKHPNKKWL